MFVLITVTATESGGIPTLSDAGLGAEWFQHRLRDEGDEGICPVVDFAAERMSQIATSHLRGGLGVHVSPVKYRRVHNRHSAANAVGMLAQSAGSILYIDGVVECDYTATSTILSNWKQTPEQYRPAAILLVHHVPPSGDIEKSRNAVIDASWRGLTLDEFLVAQDIRPDHQIELTESSYSTAEAADIFSGVYRSISSSRPVTQGRLIESVLTASEHLGFQDDTIHSLIEDGLDTGRCWKPYEHTHLEEAHRLTSYVETMIAAENAHIERRAREENERFIERASVARESGEEVSSWGV